MKNIVFALISGIILHKNYEVEGSNYPSNPEDYYGFKPKFDVERFSFFDTELQQTISEAEQQRNWVVSPASVKTVLGMVYEGAADMTERDLARVLRLPLNKTSSLRSLHSIQRELFIDPGRGVQWVMANRLISSAKLPLTQEYIQAMRSMYRATVDLSKFDSPANVAADINNWIYNATGGFIPTLVSSDSISRDSQLILLNAVYFKADWLYPFNKKFSQKECFYPEPNKCKEVNMMVQRAYVKYGFYQQLFAHIIELPYANSRFSMVLLVPETQGGLADVLKNLPFCPILPFLKNIGPSEVELSLPSFNVEYSNDLTDALTKMGARSMFSDEADLRYMLGRGRAKISKIIHKAKIVVNEKGTEAGAGTAGVIVPLMNSQVVQLTVNHPFLIYVRDQRTGFIFMGQINDPSQKT